MMIRQTLSLRDAADRLQIEPVLLARLCRYLKIDARDHRFPLDVVDRARDEEQLEARYAVLRSWLLTQHAAPRSG